MLIRAFGLLWNPDTVDWGKRGAGNKGNLKGKIKRNGHTHTIDFWEAQGLYVLHADFKAIYVGKADSKRLASASRTIFWTVSPVAGTCSLGSVSQR